MLWQGAEYDAQGRLMAEYFCPNCDGLKYDDFECPGKKCPRAYRVEAVTCPSCGARHTFSDDLCCACAVGKSY